MYHLQNFLGNRFDRIQAIIDNEHSQMNLYANLIGSANYSFSICFGSIEYAI